MKKSKSIQTNERLMNLWNWSKNDQLFISPEEMTSSSIELVWWYCPICDKEWEQSVSARYKAKYDCPNRHGHIPYKESVCYKKPDLVKDWDYEENDWLKPEMFKPTDKTEVFWKCNQGHKYMKSIKNKVKHCDCPECSKIKMGQVHKKKVIWIKNGKKMNEFPSITEASIKTGIRVEYISYCCLGKRKDVEGNIFLYKKDVGSSFLLPRKKDVQVIFERLNCYSI